MDMPIFEQITSALTVKSICSPFSGPDIPAGSNVEHVGELVLEYGDEFQSRVVSSDGSVVGLLRVVNELDVNEEKYSTPDTIVDELMERVAPNELVTSNTTILDAVEIFGSKSNAYFYVIHINEVVSVLNYSDLFKPLGRLAFLALALAIEN